MGYQEAWAALNMEKTAVVPRTEYSLGMHWDLIKAETGLSVDENSSDRWQAVQQLEKKWDVSFNWSTLVGGDFLKGRRTSMGHANYMAQGADFSADVRCPFAEVEDVLAFDPVEEFGLYDVADLRKQFNQHWQAQTGPNVDAVTMSGTYITMFSGLIDIFGWEMLLAAGGEDPEGMGEVARRYERFITPFFKAFAESDVPVMMVHDDICWTSGPVFAPDWYRQYIFSAYKRLWAPVLEAGKRLVYTSDGNYTMFFDDIVACGAHSLVMEPCSDMALFAKKYGKTHGFVGNADTRILLSGSDQQIRNEVRRCMDIGKECPGFIMAVGNHIPPNTPVHAAQVYNEAYFEMRKRD